MNQEQRISRALSALDAAIVYIEEITGRDCNESPTYQHLIKELRECGEDVDANAPDLVQLIKSTDAPFLYMDLRTLRNTEPEHFKKLVKELADVNKFFKG